MNYPYGYGQQPPRQDPASWGTSLEQAVYPPELEWQESPPRPAPAPEPGQPKRNPIVAAAMIVVALLAIAGVGVAVIAPRPSTVAGPSDTAPLGSSPGRFSNTEMAHDWNFTFGDVELHADWVEGRDYDNCRNFEVDGKLTGLGCQYAAELNYRAEGGALRIAQLVIGMPDTARAVASLDQFTDADLHLRTGTFINRFATGKWRTGSEKEIVVITIATATAAVPLDTVKKYLQYRHADTLGALAFR